MSQNEKKRQESLLKKKRKARTRKNRLSYRLDFNSYLHKKGLMMRAKIFPIFECLISNDWQDMGLARILISRKQPNNKLIIGVFLVDIYCLGLKNTFCNANIALEDYEKLKLKMFQETSPVPCHPGLAHRIIYGAIEYARKLGFEPQEDFSLSRFVLDETTDSDFSFEVKFGKDGMPLYISGPDDDVDYIMDTLSKNVGEGNFHYLITSG